MEVRPGILDPAGLSPWLHFLGDAREGGLLRGSPSLLKAYRRLYLLWVTTVLGPTKVTACARAVTYKLVARRAGKAVFYSLEGLCPGLL